jgi:hypothetical protein
MRIQGGLDVPKGPKGPKGPEGTKGLISKD